MVKDVGGCALVDIWQDRFVKREMIPAGELAKRFNLKNHRKHPENQSAAVEASLDNLGWIDDIKLSTNGDGPPDIDKNPDAIYIDGENRTKVALAKFGPDVGLPVSWYHLSPAATDAAIKYLDAMAAMAEIDYGILEANPLELEFQIPEIELALGFEVEKLEPKDAPPQIDKAEAEKYQEIWQVKPGDVWQLGRHKVACMDSTDEKKAKDLIGDKVVTMVWADPPYGIELDTDYSKLKGTEKSPNALGYTYPKVIGDDERFNFGCFSWLNCKEQFWWGADYYATQLSEGGSWLVWLKRNEADSEMIGNDFELCWSKARHKRRAIRIRWVGWGATETNEKRTHPTQKPIELPKRIFGGYGNPSDVIFDPFLGSGISVIAAEQLADGRKVIGCDLAPEYIATTIQRWVDATGGEAHLIGRLD